MIFLNKNGNFCTKIGRGVFWVPVISLGKSMYDIHEITNIIKYGKFEKQMFRSLYDIVQLFLKSNFKYNLDTKYLKKNGIIWEVHEEINNILNNGSGCCASVAAWLNYYLEGVYEDCGYLSFNRPNGSGHIMNYIFQDDWYYLIDMTPYVIDEEQKEFYETGKKVDYIKSKNVTGILTKCKSLKEYAMFYDSIQMTKGYNFIYFKHKGTTVPPISVETYGEKIDIIYPQGYEIECVYNGAASIYSLKFAEY